MRAISWIRTTPEAGWTQPTRWTGVLALVAVLVSVGPAAMEADSLSPDDDPDRGDPAVSAAPASQADASAAALLIELRLERAALERRAFELETRERALAEAERELVRRIEEFRSTRSGLEERLDRIEEGLGGTTKQLSKTYAAMPPERAAVLIADLDRELASSILRRMRAKQSAAVLGGMRPEAARDLSIRLARPFAPPRPEASRRPRAGGQR